uniref:formin-like protein 5 n=1 Tax=Erigeron canadensis TaxID=72917 RepID=UPI001CB8A58C|nr:formin-like protein 5 [Erigeron canadensis]
MGAKIGLIWIMTVFIIILLHPNHPLAKDSDKIIDLDEETMDDDTAELLWVNCRAELVYSIEAINVQDPRVKKTILDCLRDKRIVLSKSRKYKLTKNWYIGYLASFLHKTNDVHGRRRLAEGGVSQGTIIVAVVVTAVSTLSLAGLLFYCYIRNYGVAAFQNDENLSMGKNSTSGGSKNSSSSKDKDGNTENQSNSMDARVSVDSGLVGNLHMKTNLNPTVHPPAERVTSSLRHTLKPRAIRAESSLRPTGKAESSLRPSAGKTDSPVGGTDSSPRPSPGAVESSPRLQPVTGVSHVSSPTTIVPSPSTAPIAPSHVTAPLAPSPATDTAPGPPANPPIQEDPPTGGEPPPSPPVAAAPPPPPPSITAPPPPPKLEGNAGGPPPPPRRLGASIRPPRRIDQADASKAKLKPFFWDKVMAKPDQQMVWDKIKSGSFHIMCLFVVRFNEEMIESLFGYQGPDKTKDPDTKNAPAKESTAQFVQIIDPKKAQNLSILLKALNVTTDEVAAALIEGNELPIEIVQTLLKMAPTSEEELKLRLYCGDLSRLGPAERFLKALVEIPYAFRRLESLLFMCTLQDEESNIRESFEILEAACVELKKSRLFLKLLEAVLKTGNRMNVGTFRGSATAVKLDTLLKLSDVKGVDGKTTLLHFVVQEIMRGEGIKASQRAKDGSSICSVSAEDLFPEPSPEKSDEHYCKLGLEVVLGLSNELENVTKASIIDFDGLSSSISKLGNGLVKARESLNTDRKNLEENSKDAEADEFWLILSDFVENAEKDISWMFEEEKRIIALVKSTADYFHGKAVKDEGLRLFSVVRDFLIILEKVCKEIQAAPIKPPKKKDDTLSGTQDNDDDNQFMSGDPSQPQSPSPFF